MLANVGCFYVLSVVKISVWNDKHNKKGDRDIGKGGDSKVSGEEYLRGNFSEEGFVRLLVSVGRIPPPSPQQGETLDVWQGSGYASGSGSLE